MLGIYGNNLDLFTGGVEIFNFLMQKELEARKIPYHVLNKHKYYKENKFLGELISCYKAINCPESNQISNLVIHYSNFYEILAIPILKLKYKNIHVISHVGNTWKHVTNPLTLFITNLILFYFVNNLFIIAEVQRRFLKHKNLFKISTIIDPLFATASMPSDKNGASKPYILYLGRICKEKGVIDLIISYSDLLKEMDLPILKLVGPIDISFKKHIINLINTHNLSGKIIINDPVYAVKDKISLIDNCVFGIYPSYVDAFPLTLLEFYSRGKICICSNISEAIDFVNDSRLLITPGSHTEIIESMRYMIQQSHNLGNDILILKEKALRYSGGALIDDLLYFGVA